MKRALITIFVLFVSGLFSGVPQAEAAPKFEDAYRRSQTTGTVGIVMSTGGILVKLVGLNSGSRLMQITGNSMQVIGFPMGAGGGLRGARVLRDLNVRVSTGAGVSAWVTGLSSVVLGIYSMSKESIGLLVVADVLYLTSLGLMMGQLVTNRKAARRSGLVVTAPQRKKVQVALAPAISKKGGGMVLSGRF